MSITEANAADAPDADTRVVEEVPPDGDTSVTVEATKFYEGVGFSDPDLAVAYENSTGAVVFIDESYRTPAQAIHNQSFYILSGIVIDRSRMSAIRERLVEIAGSNRWHTTEENRTEDGRDRILKMDRYVARTADAVFALHGKISPNDPSGEDVRERSQTALLSTLCAQGVLEVGGLAVYDSRRDTSQQNRDIANFARMRKAGAIHRNLETYAGGPGSEALLWAADVAAWSLRQAVTRQTASYFDPYNRSNSTQVIQIT